MKVLANETKRILAVLLSVAMIFAYVPNNVVAYADDNTEEAQSGSDSGESTDESEQSYSDVSVELKTSSNVDWDEYTTTTTGRIDYANSNCKDRFYGMIDDVGGTNTATEAADTENGYQVYLYVQEGFDFDEDEPIKKVSYKDYRKKDYANIGYEPVDAELSSTPVAKDSTSLKYSIEKVEGNDRVLLVTIPKGLVQEVLNASRCKDYDATDDTKKTYCADSPTISILANDAASFKSRSLPMPTITGASTKTTFDQNKLKAEWVVLEKHTEGGEDWPIHTDRSWSLKGIADYITDATLTADMIKVTMTKDGKATTVTASEAAIDQSEAAVDAGTANYVQYDTTNKEIKIGSKWINDFVYGKADITVAIDCSGAAAKEKTISVVANDSYVKVYKTGTTTNLDGTKYNITDDYLTFDVNTVKNERTVKQIVIKENTDGTTYKLTVPESSSKPTYTFKQAIKAKHVDNDITVTVTTQEAVQDESTVAAVSILDSKGKAVANAETATDFVFEARPVVGKRVKTVEYKVGNGNWTSLTLSDDNFYTIEADKVVDEIHIKATTETAEGSDLVTPVAVKSSVITGLYSGVGTANVFNSTVADKSIVTAGFYGSDANFDTWYNTKTHQASNVAGESSHTTDRRVLGFVVTTDADDWPAALSSDHWGVRIYFAETGEEFYDCSDGSIAIGSDPYDIYRGIFWRIPGNMSADVFPGGEIIVQPFTFAHSIVPDGDIYKCSDAWCLANKDKFTMRGYPVALDFGDITAEGTSSTNNSVEPLVAQDAGVSGKYFYFTATTDGKSTPVAYYKMSEDGDYYKATPVSTTVVSASETDFVFRTDRIEGTELYLDVDAVGGAKVLKPENPYVDIQYVNDDGEVVNFEDASVVAPVDENFDILIQPKESIKSTIKIERVQWTNDGNEPDDEDDGLITGTDGLYTLNSTVLAKAGSAMDANGVRLFVYTSETMNDSAYTTKFALSSENTTTKNPHIVTNSDGSQTIKMIFGETLGNLSATVKTTDGVPRTVGTVNTVATKKGAAGLFADSYAAVDGDGKNIVTLSSGVNIKANKLGEDKVTAILEEEENIAGETKAFNKKVYTADLNAEVTGAYTGLELVCEGAYGQTGYLMADEDGLDDEWSNKVLSYRVIGTNVRTGKVETIPGNGNGIKLHWSFDPDTKDMTDESRHYKMSSAYSTDFATNTGAGAAIIDNNNRIYVRADESGKAVIVATCEIDGVTDTKKWPELRSEFDVIDEVGYGAFTTAQVKNSPIEEYGWDADEIHNGINGKNLELVSGGRNSMDVNLDIYERVGDIPAAVTNSDDLKEVLDEGTYKASTGITWKGTVYNYDATKEDYVEDKSATTKYVSITDKGNGAFTVTATEATGNYEPKVVIVAEKDGVVAGAESFYVSVVKEQNKQSVQLILDDEGDYEVEGNVSTPVQKKLLYNSKYQGKDHSIVEPNTTLGYKEANLVKTGDKYGTDIASFRGVIFNSETEDSAFTLPTMADFDPDTLVDGRILAYWQKVDSTTWGNPITVGLGTDYEDFYYPGEEVEVNGVNSIFKAIWKSEYEFTSAASATTEAADRGKGLAIYNENFEVKDPDDDTKVTGYGPEFAQAEDTAAAATTTPGIIAGGGSVPVVLELWQNTAYSKELAALAKKKHKVASDEGITKEKVWKKGSDLSFDITGVNKSAITARNGVLTADAGADNINTGIKVAASWKNGKTEYSTVPMDFKVSKAPEYTATINDGKTLEVNVDQSSDNVVNIVLKNGTTAITAADYEKYNFTWEVDKAYAEIDTAKGKDDVLATATITPIAETTSLTATLTIKDSMGCTTTAELPIKIKTNGVTFKVEDADKNTVALADGIWAVTDTDSLAGEYYLTATGVTFGAVTVDNKIVKSGTITNGTGLIKMTTADLDLSDKGWIKVAYTISGDSKKYVKKIKVSTYYPIVLDADDTAKTFITVDGKKYVDSSDAAKDYVARVTPANIIDPKADTIKYTNIDLSKYSAVNESTDPKEMKGWDTAAAANKVVFETGSTIANKYTLDGLVAIAGLYPVISDEAITGVTLAQNVVTISNETGTYIPSGMSNTRSFAVTVEPYNTKATIALVPDKYKLYQSVVIGDGDTADKKAKEGSVTAENKDTTKKRLDIASGKVTLTVADASTVDTTGKKRTDKFSLGAITGDHRRAGVVKFDLVSDDVTLETLTVNIDGYDSVDKTYYESGQLVKSDGRSVSGTMKYFDEEGKWVEGDKIITKADGSKIAIVDGVLASAGKANIGGKTYVVGANGVLVTGWIDKDWKVTTDASNGMYYADPEDDGALVAAGTLKKIGDKTYYFGTNQQKVVGSDKANLYEKTALSGDYHVNKDGEVAINGIFKVAGVDRLFREDATIVSYADSDVTKATPDAEYGIAIVAGARYKVYKTDDRAEADHTEHVWEYQSMDWSGYSFETQTGTVTAKFVCKAPNAGEEGTAPATVKVENKAVKGTETELGYTVWKFTAKADKDPSGATASKATETVYKQFRGGAWTDATEADWKKAGGDGNYDDDAEEDGIFTASFASGEDSYEYTGYSIKPEIIVNNGEKTLVNGVDYTVSYKNNVKVGDKSAQAIVKGKGNYSKTSTLTFSITKADISNAVFGNLAYKTGTATDKIKPSGNYNGKALKLGTDFTLGALGDIDPSNNTQTLEIKGAGANFEGEKTVTLRYSAKPETIQATFSFPKAGFTYTGEDVINADGKSITDYFTVTNKPYEDANVYVTMLKEPVDAGSYKVTVTCDGLKGSKSGSFKIVPAKTATMTVTNQDDLTAGVKFNVLGSTPYVAVNAKLSDSVDYDLTPGKDYKVTYKNNKAAGTGNYTVTFQGNYKGATKLQGTFKINKAKLNDATIQIAGDFVRGKNDKSKQYFAKADNKLFVSVGGMKLAKSEYAITYKQGDTTLTGKGAETIAFEEGKATITVEIRPSAKAKSLELDGDEPMTATYDVLDLGSNQDVSKLKLKVVEKGGTKTAKVGYTGTSITFAQDDDKRQGDIIATGKIAGSKVSLTAKDIEDNFDVQYVNNVQKGKGYVILTAKDGNDKNYVGSIVGTFTIKAHTFTEGEITAE